MNLQGQLTTGKKISEIQRLLRDNPHWHRTRLSQELCLRWQWKATNGQIKDMACRNLLLKLERTGHIILPPPQSQSYNNRRNRSFADVEHEKVPIDCSLYELLPISFFSVGNAPTYDSCLFNYLLDRYHYLGYRGTAGENLKYLVRDRHDRPLACVLFGSAAWKCQARDRFIGWDAQARKQNLCLVTNNSRFLLLPWVHVPCLASHILGGISRRLNNDWMSKYGHPIYFLETFVEHRFKGACYRAANWHYLGATQGRSRNDRHHCISVPVKDVYGYPLRRRFKRRLCHAS